MPASLPFRLVRAAVFAAVCAGLGMAAHLVAGGVAAPSSAAASLGLSFLAALPLTGRERSPAAVLGLLAAAQAGLHVLFSLAHDAAPVAAGGHAHSGLVPGLGMLVMHGWAVGLTALWLARGETALWALFRRVLVRLCLLWAVPGAPPAFSARHPEPGTPRSAVLRHAVSRRGPPAFLFT